VLLQSVTDRGKGPEVVAEKLLEGTDGDPGVEGQRLTGLAREVGEKAAAVDLKQLKGLRVATAEEELLQVVGKSGSQSNNLFSSHRNTSGLTQRYEEHFAHQLVKIRSAVVLKEHEKVQVTIHTAVSRVRASSGLLGWTGDAETVERLALDDEFGILETP